MKSRLNGMTFTRPISLMRIERIQKVLTEQPSSIQEIADSIYMSRRAAGEYINYLREKKMVYVHSYRREQREHYNVHKPLLAWGDKEDTPHPERNERIRTAEYRTRIKADADRNDEYLAKRRAQRKAKLIQPKMDWTTAWMRKGAV